VRARALPSALGWRVPCPVNHAFADLAGLSSLPGYDPTAAVGPLTADHRTFTVTVIDNGSIIVSLGARAGMLPPVINAVRVTHRPDL
jgi:hypothetical protein